MRAFRLVAILLVCGTSRLWSQTKCLDQVKLPEVGRWAEYKAQHQQNPYTIRYSVIGSESRGGKDLRWVEMQMTGAQKDRNMVYQMLVPGSFTEMDQVQEVVFKPGNQPAMKLSGQMLAMMRGQLQKQSFLNELCKGVSLVGKETVTVPAGRFETLHFRNAEHGADSWVSSDVPFSMVKSTGKEFQMELATQGKGAKSSITEKPQEMGGMGGRPN